MQYILTIRRNCLNKIRPPQFLPGLKLFSSRFCKSESIIQILLNLEKSGEQDKERF